MPTSTYTPIYTTTLGSAQSSVTLNSFSGYTDLVVVCSVTANSTADWLTLRFNSDTGTNYSVTTLQGTSSNAAVSQRQSSVDKITLPGFTNTMGSTVPSTNIFNVQNYSNSTTYKTVLSRGGTFDNSTTAAVGAVVGLWRSTSAVTSMSLFMYSGNSFKAGSTFTLYGIKAA